MAATYRLKDLPLVLVNNYLAKVNTFLRGKPAIGKTQTIEAFATEMAKRLPAFKLWSFYAPTMSPMDIVASAPDYTTNKLKLYANAALPNAYDDADMVGVVFFGELPNADPATIRLLQKYINGEDMSGTLRKPAGVVVIADGNRLEDKSGVQQQGRAFLSRFEQLEVYATAEDNVAFAAKHAWHPTVQMFFRDNPALIDNYDEVFEMSSANLQRGAGAKSSNGSNQQAEEGKLGIWANMRSWERISAKEYAAETMGTPGREVSQSEIAGNVGTAVAAQYQAHRKILASLSSFEDIMNNPDGIVMPTKMDEQYMLAMLVSLRCKDDQLEPVRKFGERMPLEMQAVMLRNMSSRVPQGFKLTSGPHYLAWIKNKELVTMLNGR